MCCNSRSALVQSVLPANPSIVQVSLFCSVLLLLFLLFICTNAWAFHFSPIFSGEIPCGNALINAVACCSVEHMSAICKSNAQASQPTMAECSVVKPEHPLSSRLLSLFSLIPFLHEFWLWRVCLCVCVCKHCAKPKTTKLFIRYVVPQPKTSARERERERGR